MKRTLLTIAFAIIISTLSFAQKNHTGVKLGANLTTIKFSDGIESITPDRAFKWHFGFYFNRMISETVAVQPEIMYHAVGYKPETGAPVDDITLSYIAIPVMLKYYVSETFNIHAGPQLGILVGGTKFNGVSITEGTKSTEIALGIGAEMKVAEIVDLSIRYVGGANTDDSGLDFDQKSSTFQISLNMRIDKQLY